MAKSGKKATVGKVNGSSPTHTVAGGPGKSFPQQPLAGPTNPGQPIAMKRALAKKSGRNMVPNMAGTGKGI